MDAYQRVIARVALLSPDAVRRFACACAGRLLGAVEVLMTAASVAECRAVMACAQGGMMSPAAAGVLVKRVEALPEADVDDSLDARYLAMVAIGLVFHAARAAGADVASGPAVAGLALDLAAEMCSRSDGEPLVRLVEDAQLADVESLARGGEVSREYDQAITEASARCVAARLRSDA